MPFQEETLNVEEAHLSNNKNWAQCIHPLVVWIEVLSVGILNGNRNRLRVFYGFVCLFLNIIGQAVYLYYIFENFKKHSQSYVSEGSFNSNASSWNTAIDFINFAVHSISTHLYLIFFFRPRWTLLINAIGKLEILFNAETFVKIHRITILCLTYIILVVTGQCVSFAYYHAWRGASWDVITIGLVSIASSIHLLSVVTLFVVVIYTTSFAYQVIWSSLNILRNVTADSQRYVGLVTFIQNYHILICETIDIINHCFGWILVFHISFHFVAVLTVSFYLFGHIGWVAFFMPFKFFIAHSFHLFFICYIADSLRNQAESIMKELVDMQADVKEPMKSLISAFAAQVKQFSPEVTGVGFFLVNKRIIPKVITTTLTYFIILYQFESSEKEIIPVY